MADQIVQNALDAIALQGFRNLADYDYVSARVSFRLNLREQFYWSALQAVEKYLKAILLFNGQKVTDIWHDLSKARTLISKNTSVPLVLGADQLHLFDVLEKLGNNRYHTTYTQMLGDELPKLDRLIWTVRHYARSTSLEIDGVDKSEWYAQKLRCPDVADTPTSNQMSNGELEDILARDCTDQLRQELVWCNYYYGKQENAKPLPVTRSSSHVPINEREWFTNGICEDGTSLADTIKKYVQLRS